MDVDIDFDEGFPAAGRASEVVGALYEKPVYSPPCNASKRYSKAMLSSQYQLHEHPVVGYDIVGYTIPARLFAQQQQPQQQGVKNGLS